MVLLVFQALIHYRLPLLSLPSTYIRFCAVPVEMSLSDFISAIEEISMAEVDQNLSEENVEHPLEIEEPEQKDALVNDTDARGGEKKWPGWPGESVFRMLVPAQKVGGLIGRKGELIKKIVEETKSRIKVLDGPPGTPERVVMVSAKEELESSLPPAIDGLLRIHKSLHDCLEEDASNATSGVDASVSAKLLVPSSQAGFLIGKQGGTVKSIQEATNCIVRVLGQEELPVLALRDDRVVEVVGDLASVRNAIEIIALLLRKFLVDRSVIPMFEVNIANPHQPWNVPGYRPTQYMLSPQIDGSYMLAEVPPSMDKQSHHGISAHGRAAPSNSLATQQMQVPLSYADAVIGHGGTNISYIRRASGATVTIQEARDLPAEMAVEISGRASQVQSAKQLIQDFMSEAAAAQQPMKVGPTDQEYNSFPDNNSVYACPSSTPGNSGGYVLVYGANCGY